MSLEDRRRRASWRRLAVHWPSAAPAPIRRSSHSVGARESWSADLHLYERSRPGAIAAYQAVDEVSTWPTVSRVRVISRADDAAVRQRPGRHLLIDTSWLPARLRSAETPRLLDRTGLRSPRSLIRQATTRPFIVAYHHRHLLC